MVKLKQLHKMAAHLVSIRARQRKSAPTKKMESEETL